MKLGTIPDPLAGEKVVDIVPKLAPFVEPTPLLELNEDQDKPTAPGRRYVFPSNANYVEATPRLGRINYFPGRHLTAPQLRAEQRVRVHRLMLRGRAVDHGVVSGLEVSSRATTEGVQFQVEPGQALTARGTDIVVDHAVAAMLSDIRLYDHASRKVLDTPIGAMPTPPETAFAAVLLLQPGYAEDTDLPQAAQVDDNGTDFKPGPRVPDDEVYYRTTTTDAARLVLYPLPPGWAEPLSSADDTWQNRAAWRIFEREAQQLALAYYDLGVPLALIGFNAALEPQWIDRHAVVRPAGKPRRRALVAPSLDDAPEGETLADHLDSRVWIARFEQFCAQLSALSDPLPATQLFQLLPPIGMLPKTYLDLTKQAATGAIPAVWLPSQSFFPKGYAIDVSVIPLEQLDALVDDTAALLPYDLGQLDAVRLLLPVSQQWFDPDLLKIEVIDPQFDEHIQAYRTARGTILAQRYDLANRRAVLELSVNGVKTDYPLTTNDADPKRLESPESVDVPPGAALQYGVTRAGTTAAPSYLSQLQADLQARGEVFLREFTPEDQKEFAELFKACGLTSSDIVAVFAGAKVPDWVGKLVVNAPGTTQPLTLDEQNELRRELLLYIKKQLDVQEAEHKQLYSSSLQGIIDYFTAKADEADELVDAGFLKMRTDVFRLGTLLTNNSLGTKFAASPSLANIIERKPAKADKVGVNAYASQLLANFAPSAASKVATTTTVAAQSDDAAANASGSGVQMKAMLFKAPAAELTAKYTLPADDIVKAFDDSKNVFTANQNAVLSIRSKLNDTDQKAFDSLMTTLQAPTELLTSTNIRDTLADASKLNTFASGYVENFNLLSQKQIRAIPLDRLQPALAPTVRNEIHDGRLEIFERLTRLNISLGELVTDFVDVPGTAVRPPVLTTTMKLTVTRIRFQTLISRRVLDSLSTTTDTEVVDADESKHFTSGVSYADMAMAALRAVEARIKDYRAFVEDCRAVLKQSQAFSGQLTTALAGLETDLEEARQDVAVALALKAEEQARLDAINDHREKILREHVEFLVYTRPRAVMPDFDVPSHVLEPALTSEPVIDCIQENPSPPADLSALRDIFRSSPAKWFKYAPQWIEKVDQWDHLRAMLDRASRTTIVNIEQAPAISSGRYTQTLGKIYQTRQSTSQKYAVMAQTINPAVLVALSWKDLRVKVQEQLTLGHLIAAGPAPLAKSAAEELDHLFVVTTCLHCNFCEVPGLIRLDWAEKFGQFDNINVDFRDLSRLPSWAKIEFTLRREMQIHADWIYGRIDQTQPEAIDLINDLIRVALLLASHAPVDQLIVGQPLESNVTALPGLLINLKVDPLRVRRGMDVIYQASPTQTLRATVEDISFSHVAVRVTDAPLLNGAPIKVTPASTFFFKAAAN
jgi:hypothetical protein